MNMNILKRSIEENTVGFINRVFLEDVTYTTRTKKMKSLVYTYVRLMFLN